jgi:hypothetical protein
VPAERATPLTLDYSFLSSAKRLELDGREIAKSGMGMTWEHSFPIATKTATVKQRMRWLIIPDAELTVDGTTIAPIDAPPAPPWWVWLFIIGNLSVLILTAGGAIPGAIAGVGAATSVYVTMIRQSELVRFLLCMAVTAATWGAIGLLIKSMT